MFVTLALSPVFVKLMGDASATQPGPCSVPLWPAGGAARTLKSTSVHKEDIFICCCSRRHQIKTRSWTQCIHSVSNVIIIHFCLQTFNSDIQQNKLKSYTTKYQDQLYLVNERCDQISHISTVPFFALLLLLLSNVN